MDDTAPAPTSSDEQHPSTHSVSELSRKGTPWSVEEHYAFLQGLDKLGRGNWRGISRFFVPTRTPTQVASHAQKHFLRVGGNTKRRSRFAAIEEEVYGPPGKTPMLAAGTSVRQSSSSQGGAPPRPAPVAALPPRAPHVTQPSQRPPAPAGNPPRPYSTAPAMPPKPQPMHAQGAKPASHEMCPGVPNTAMQGMPPMPFWGHPGAMPPHCMFMPAGAMAPGHGDHPSAWMSPAHGFMWGAPMPVMNSMAIGQPVPRGVSIGQPAATTSTSSCGHSQAQATGHEAAPGPASAPRGPVSLGPSEDVVQGMTANGMVAGNVIAAGYPAGAFFSMPAFMHSAMNPMMQFAMQATAPAGTAAPEPAGVAPQPTQANSAGGAPSATPSQRSPATSSSTQPSHTLVVNAQQLSADCSQRDRPDTHHANDDAIGLNQLADIALGMPLHDEDDEDVAPADDCKHVAAECSSKSQALLYRPEALTASWKPGTCTPPEVSLLLAQLQRSEFQQLQQHQQEEEEEEAHQEHVQEYAPKQQHLRGPVRPLGTKPSRPSAFKALVPAVISV